jgi:hypothetical protein
MKPSINERLIAYLTLLSGLSISAVAVYYSVSGLTAIFSAAVLPIIIMGVTLEVSKLIATVWLKQNWSITPYTIKAYLMVAIAVLMMITSLGIFGFLSKAHSDQSLVSGDVMSKIAIYDEKIRTEKENIDVNRHALKQMDEAVDQVMSRSTSETGAGRAVSIRKSQAKERTRLLNEISTMQRTIVALNEERAPIAAEVRKVEAEVGPIKYIAAFFYGSTDPAILERAVTWVIITLIVVFDPLAVVLLLASQVSFQNFKKRNMEGDSPAETQAVIDPQPLTVTDQEVEPDVTPVNVDPVATPVVEPELTLVERHPYLFQGDSFWKMPAGWVDAGPQVCPPEVREDDRPEQAGDVVSESTVTEPLTHDYVQNEEQQQSNQWTNTMESISREHYQDISLSKLEDYIDEIVELVKSGHLELDEVPRSLQQSVKSRI